MPCLLLTNSDRINEVSAFAHLFTGVMASAPPKLGSPWRLISAARFLGLGCLILVTSISYSITRANPVWDCESRSPAPAISYAIAGNHSTRMAGNVPEPVDPAKKPAEALTIFPKIIVLSSPPFWATGTNTVVMKISLEAIRGNQRIIYKQHPKISLILRPANASFSNIRVDIPDGSDESDPFTLTSSKADVIEVTCAPDSNYSGPLIAQPEPAKIVFIEPIDKIGIEPVFDESLINVGATFRVFLYNEADLKKKHLSPADAVTVHLSSQTENGTLDKVQVDLTDKNFSQNVRYVGTKLGYDTITAFAHYQRNELTGASNRRIVFPWLTFLVGLLGTLIGTVLRAKLGEPDQRLKSFVESSLCGLIFSTVVILYPIGTNLPQISTYLQPALAFVLTLFMSFVGPTAVNWGLSWLPSKGK